MLWVCDIANDNRGNLWIMRIMHIIKRLLCRLLKHNQTGPIPIGRHKDVRYVCYRCKQIQLIRDNTVYTFYDENDPAVIFVEKMQEIGK